MAIHDALLADLLAGDGVTRAAVWRRDDGLLEVEPPGSGDSAGLSIMGTLRLLSGRWQELSADSSTPRTVEDGGGIHLVLVTREGLVAVEHGANVDRDELAGHVAEVIRGHHLAVRDDAER